MTDVTRFYSILFYLYRSICSKCVCRCSAEAETQNLEPQVSTVAGKQKSPVTGRNFEQDGLTRRNVQAGGEEEGDRRERTKERDKQIYKQQT